MKPPAAQSPSSPPWPQLILLAVVLVTFAPLIPHDFVMWDDQFHLTENPWMNPATFDTLAHYWRNGDGTMYNPVTYTFWVALTSVARVSTPDPQGVTLNPMVFHACNVLMHAGSAVMAFAVLHLLTGHRIAAVLGAMVFALHPVQVDSVGWISGLKDVLWGFFSLAAIACYLIYARENKPAFYVGGLMMLVLAMLSKPTAMVTPALIIVIDRLLLQRPWKRVLLNAGPWLALSVPCMIVARMIQTGSRSDPGPLWARPLIAADSLAFYVYKVLWPLELAPDYGHRPAAVIASGALYWTWIVPLALAGIAVWQLRRRPWIAAGLAMFAIGTMPTLGWIPFSFQFYSTTADHYLYVSMLGIGVIVAYLVANATWPIRRIVAVAAVPLVLLAGRTMLQTRVWADSRTLFTHTLAVNDRSFIARIQLAILHIRANEPEAAEPLLRQAIELEPGLPRGYQALSSILWSQGRRDEAAPLMKKYIELQSSLPRDRRVSLAEFAGALADYYQQRGDDDTALQWRQFAVEESPDDPVVRAKFIAAVNRRTAPPATQP